jgi:tRNA threonylcarbamoyladenosine biosynthesis protein TsaB
LRLPKSIGGNVRILALETSGARGSVAALVDGGLLVELPLNAAQRGAQALAPAISEVLRKAAWEPRQVELVAVAIGPGSFTSLRVGVTTAKTFAYAVGAEVFGVGALEAIAVQVDRVASGETIATAIDAGRGEVYAAQFRWRAPFDLECLEAPAVHSVGAWLAGLESRTIVSGPALDKLAASGLGIRVAPRELWLPSAATIGRLAAMKHAAGERDDVWRLMPLYLRKSAAEEKAGGGS